jgi:hypothetical protein
MTAGTGQLGQYIRGMQDSRDRTARTGHPDRGVRKNSGDDAAKAGKREQDNKDRTDGTRQQAWWYSNVGQSQKNIREVGLDKSV